MTTTVSRSRGALSLPAAIIIAGALIAIAIIWIDRPSGAAAPAAGSKSAGMPSSQGPSGMAPVSASDHILGDPNAPVKLVEYSDPSCPYCKMFDPTMQSIMAQYGPTGQVAWVYRQFPLDKPDQSGNILHPNAGTEAQAFECAADLGGNRSFFAYVKAWYDAFPENGADRAASVDDAQIATVAKSVGLDAAAFSQCLTSGRDASKIDASYEDGLNAGVTGTPYLIVISPTGSRYAFPGGESYPALKAMIDTLLSAVPSAASASSSAAI